jgi:hypothetical protein
MMAQTGTPTRWVMLRYLLLMSGEISAAHYAAQWWLLAGLLCTATCAVVFAVVLRNHMCIFYF